jgi:prepilin-type N-terminal cleavage/methylation domain-containing protein
MAPQDLKNNSGFTLVEVLITMGILGLAVGITASLTMNDYYGRDFRTERQLAVSLLQKARAQSIANINQSQLGHGLFIDTANSQYVLFEPDPLLPLPGYDSSASSNQYITFFSAKVTHEDMTHVIFSPIDGKATFFGGDLSLDGGKSIISINDEGQITWTN